MANNSAALSRVSRMVGAYVLVVFATVAALAVLGVVSPHQATSDAWVHAAIVAGFAVLLPLRLRAARRGSARGLRAVAVIAVVLLVVNAVEASIGGLFPAWMRIEMIGIALLMAAIAATSWSAAAAAGARARR